MARCASCGSAGAVRPYAREMLVNRTESWPRRPEANVS
jgi:hypothetical protein